MNIGRIGANVNAQNQNNINFGLHIRNLENCEKLIDYWRSKGFSQDCIQTSLTNLKKYKADKPSLIGFLSILFKPFQGAQSDNKFPSIDFGKIIINRVTKVTFSDAVIENKIGKVEQNIPNITYSFQKSSLKFINKKFVTPLEKYIYTIQGEIIEPKTPKEVVKEIIKNFKLFQKTENSPNEYLLREVRPLPIVTEL